MATITVADCLNAKALNEAKWAACNMRWTEPVPSMEDVSGAVERAVAEYLTHVEPGPIEAEDIGSHEAAHAACHAEAVEKEAAAGRLLAEQITTARDRTEYGDDFEADVLAALGRYVEQVDNC